MDDETFEALMGVHESGEDSLEGIPPKLVPSAKDPTAMETIPTDSQEILQHYATLCDRACEARSPSAESSGSSSRPMNLKEVENRIVYLQHLARKKTSKT